MEKPILSPDFAIDDIHKLREYNYYLTKDMTPRKGLISIMRVEELFKGNGRKKVTESITVYTLIYLIQ